MSWQIFKTIFLQLIVVLAHGLLTFYLIGKERGHQWAFQSDERNFHQIVWERPRIRSDHYSVQRQNDMYLPEWPEMRSARNTLVKLILVVRFHWKLHPIWDSLNNQQNGKQNLKWKYSMVRAIVFCLKACCQNNLKQFFDQWGIRFSHDHFSVKRCSAGIISPM